MANNLHVSQREVRACVKGRDDLGDARGVIRDPLHEPNRERLLDRGVDHLILD